MADIASYRTLVQKFYVAYFGRPADPGGMNSMASALAAADAPTDARGFLTAYANNSTIRAIVDSFGTSDESKALYPGNTATFLAAIYQNLFGRAPDSEGLAFWTGAIDKGEVVRGQAALNILVGAESNTSALGLLDAASISNKVKIASAFTDSITTPSLVAGYAGDVPAAAARTLLGAVNGSTNVLSYLPTLQSTLARMSVASPGAPDLLAADDTGWSSADNITGQTTGLSFFGQAPGAVSVALYDNGGSTPIGSGAVVNGFYNIDVSLAPGLHNLTAKSTGSSGSSSTASQALAVIVDTTAPQAPVAVLQTDSGVAGDGLTNSGLLTVTGLETGAQLEYRVNAGNWASSLAYVEGSNVVEVRQVDAVGLASPASNKLSFTLDRAGPGIVGGTPANQGIEVAVGATLTLDFGETLTMGNGNIVLRDNTGASRSIAIDDASQVTVSGNTVVIKPATPLLPNSQYTLTLDSGTLIDKAGNGLLSTAAGSTLQFATTDTLAPTLMSSLPADNALDVVVGSTIVLTFSEPVQAGTGSFVISAGAADSRTISVSDSSKVSIVGNTVTIRPGTLSDSAHYNVQLASGVLKDLAGNAYAGIALTSTLDFFAQSASGAISLASLAPERGIHIDGAGSLVTTPDNYMYNTGNRVGTYIASAGDVNADGYDDIMISTGQNAVIVYGSPTATSAKLANLTAANSVHLSWKGNDYSGAPVATMQGVSDINGDGLVDLVFGSSNITGASYVVFGKAGGLPATMDLDKMGTTEGYRIFGTAVLTYMGQNVADAGDINGDGLHEVIISAHGPGGDYKMPGQVFLVTGTTNNTVLGTTPSALKAGVGSWFYGTQNQEQVGSGVDGVGDFNRDGYDDFLVGSIGFNSYSGKAQLIFGRAQGFADQVNVDTLTSNDGITIAGSATSGRFGTKVTGIGDFNGDGYADFAVNTYGQLDGAVLGGVYSNVFKGTASVIYGHANDGSGTLSVSALDGKNGVTFVAHSVGDNIRDISAAGDVNGDGYDDLLIGAPGVGLDAQGKAAGAAYVVFGSAKGFPALVDLATLDRTNSIRLDGAALGDRAGTAVSAAGDFNGDGFADLLVGAPEALYAGGSAYIVYGRDFTSTVSYTGGTGADSWTGTAAAQNAVGGAGNDTLSGGGGADVLYGGAGDDMLQVADLTFRRIDGGNGTDTLSLGGSGMNLDLAQCRNQVFSIEVIDLTGTGNNKLTTTLRDLLNLSDSSNTLRVIGNAGDVVAIGAGWTDGGISNGYHSYTQGQAILLVGTAVTVTF